MEIRNLNTFLQVAVMRSFTKAGEVLGYSQSNVSAQVKQLEDELGVPLFNRVGRSITLTQYGEDLVGYAQSIVSTAATIENIMRKKETTGGTLRLGIVESLYECIFKTAFTEYHRLYPMVEVVVTVEATAALLTMLSKNQIDVACLIDYPLPDSKWNVLYSKECEIAVVSGSKHRLADKSDLSLDSLADEEFIMMEDTCSYTQEFQKVMEEKKAERIHLFDHSGSRHGHRSVAGRKIPVLFADILHRQICERGYNKNTEIPAIARSPIRSDHCSWKQSHRLKDRGLCENREKADGRKHYRVNSE